MNPLIFFIWIASILVGAGIGLRIIRRIKNRPPKPKPIESNILVDRDKVPEIMHRWNTWEEMLEALKNLLYLCREADGVNELPESIDGKILDQANQAIKKAEERGEGKCKS